MYDQRCIPKRWSNIGSMLCTQRQRINQFPTLDLRKSAIGTQFTWLHFKKKDEKCIAPILILHFWNPLLSCMVNILNGNHVLLQRKMLLSPVIYRANLSSLHAGYMIQSSYCCAQTESENWLLHDIPIESLPRTSLLYILLYKNTICH